MAHSAAGKHKCLTSENLFVADLGTGTNIKVSFNGKIGGTFGGHQLSGVGELEYTYAQGASEWVRTNQEQTAQGPATIPVTLGDLINIAYAPAGKCNSKVSIEVSGDVVDTVGFKFKHKKDVWKMKGRTALLTITVLQNTGVRPCDYSAAIDSVTFCADYEAAGSGASYCISKGITDNSTGCVDACGQAADARYNDPAGGCV
jgi:hypothetical protein